MRRTNLAKKQRDKGKVKDSERLKLKCRVYIVRTFAQSDDDDALMMTMMIGILLLLYNDDKRTWPLNE